ncbi:hypothetical protein DL764_010003 [Monosporascus ibericus]|uniref:Heterokaryon incompatibility domain-containing protein n=1 Tax=Monosporascus ibericus TaxID=155417 RepID=A0A4Q4SWD4_9PEZI|nr:hypothetical protein DL764_010003 [Monosporascus ibericus]
MHRMGQSISDERRPLHERAQPFEYPSLPTPTSIRVVKLDLDVEEDLISLSMHLVDLNDAADEIPILVNDSLFTVGQSAFDFLKAWRERQQQSMRMRHVELDDWPGASIYRVPEVIWIDAICINQSDVAERNAQVTQMARIYRQARRVVVWLGPEDDFFAPAFQLMEQFRPSHDIGTPNIPPVWSSAWFNLFAVFERSWFSRAWVVQEVIVAQELVMQVGTFVFAWETILSAARVLNRRKLTDPIYAYASAEVQAAENCTDARDRVYAFIDILKRASRPVAEPSPLRRDIFPNYNLTLAEVYRDVAWHIILSGRNLDLLSFASGPTGKLQGLPTWAPDWRNRATIAASVLSAQLDNAAASATTCASWESSQISSVYGKYLHVQGNLVAIVAEVSTDKSTAPYFLGPTAEFLLKMSSVCGWTTEPLSRAEILWKTLTLNKKEMNCCTTDTMNIFSHMWRAEVKRVIRELQGKGRTSREDLEAILDGYSKRAHSLFGGSDGLANYAADDVNLDEIPPVEFQLDRYSEIMRSLSRIQMASQDDLPGDVQYLKLRMEAEIEKMIRAHADSIYDNTLTNHNSGRYDTKLKISNDVIFPWSNDQIQMRRLRKRMRIFRTEEQHFGNGPRAVENGDQVWILSGAKVPVILRPTNEGRWKVVGEAYVHGIMQGEATRQLNYQTKRIILE